MRTRVRHPVTVICATLVGLSMNAWAAPPPDLDAVVKQSMRTFEVPGMLLALVEPGQAPLTKGYGVRKLGESAPMDEHTLFSIASNSKAFTAAALAILVDEGKLSWDDKVVDRLPGFRMYDAYATSEMTIRDLLVHRSGLGLGAGDLLFWPESTVSRVELVRRLRYIKPATSFRSGYAYDNVLYVVAGQLIEAVTGDSWENFIVKRIFTPLGMSDSAPSPKYVKSTNRSWPHARLDGPSRGIGKVAPLAFIPSIANAAPAGGINASAHDMARWLQVQLDRGVSGKTRLFSAEAAKEMWTPRVLMPIDTLPAQLQATQPNFNTYALGWHIKDYRGHRVVSHGGFVEGSASITYLIPERGVGFIVMMNSEDGEAHDAIAYRLLDHYLGLPATDWVAAFAKAHQDKVANAKQVLAAAANLSSAGATQSASLGSAPGPSLELARYAGTYRDPWYGEVVITQSGDKLAGDKQSGGQLSINFTGNPGMHGTLEHVRHDTFRTHFTDRRMEDAFVTFALTVAGDIEQAKVQAISPLADFSFDYQDLLLTPVTQH